MAASIAEPSPQDSVIAIVGCGVVGRGWVPVFLRRGCAVRIYDSNPAQLNTARAWLVGQLDESASKLVSYHGDLEEALHSATYVQESIMEELQAKRKIFAAMSARVSGTTYLASSTSALDINEIARDSVSPERCYTVHPFNPASVLPVVEVMGTRSATSSTTSRVLVFLRSVGQAPILLNKFVPGYIGNRLQAAVMREALSLIADGVTNVEGIDLIMTEGLALRWALLGVVGTNYTNDDSGLVGYYGRFLESYRQLAQTLSSQIPHLSDHQIAEMSAEVKQRFGGASVSEVAHWRDSLVRAIRRIPGRQWGT